MKAGVSTKVGLSSGLRFDRQWLTADRIQVLRADTSLRQPDTLGAVHFEIANHLGNVVAVLSDRKIAVDTLAPFEIDHFLADRIMLRDYYAFGMTMPGRTWAVDSSYRFGFNGKENLALACWQDYGMRIFDRRISRFISADPLIVYGQQYAELSSYQFASNTPIQGIDLDGLEVIVLNDSEGARGAGHQAIMIYDHSNLEWVYYSKNYAKGGIFGNWLAKSNPTIERFSSLEEFASSPHNVVREGHADNYLDNPVKLDENGKPIQRYESGYWIDTDPYKNENMRDAAEKSVKSDYNLGLDDCSHVVQDALSQGSLPDRAPLRNGSVNADMPYRLSRDEFGVPQQKLNYYLFPNQKYDEITKNPGVDVSDRLSTKPTEP